MQTIDIAVIGAGLAGLTAARLAHEGGASVAVLDGAARIGGRIHGVHGDDGRVLADLGPSWVWPPHQPVIARWMGALGVAGFAQYNDGDALLDGYGGGIARQPLPGQHGMARIEGGPTALVTAMARGLPDGALRLGAPVRSIEAPGDGPLIVTAGGARLAARRVILTAPLRVAAATIALPEAPRALTDLMADMPTWMAAQAKAAILYNAPFWRAQGLSGRIASRTGPLVEVHDHCAADGSAALFGFVGWPPEARDPTTLRVAILAQLARCFGPGAPAPRDLVVHDWARDPLICAPRDLGAAAHPEIGPKALRQAHLGGRLLLAASETSDLSPGLIEGALAAGERAARMALAR
jgi:monoamine oxidase